MRRQLYRGGGIAGLYPRQKYGIGSWVKERVRKLIPNELADVAAKAAPFVAPFNPLAAGIMRGVGRFDKRGSISDALKQGLLTYGGGQVARHLGGAGMQTGFDPRGGMGAGQGAWSTPIGTDTGFKMGAWGGATTPTVEAARTVGTSGAPGGGDPSMFLKPGSDQGFFSKVLFGSKEGAPVFGDKGLIGAGGEFGLKKAWGKGVPAVFAGSTLAAMATQKALNQVGEREPGESLTEFNKRREDTVGQYLAYYYKRANKFRIPPEEMDAAAAKFVADNTKEYVSQGGRIGYQTGGISTPYDVSAYKKSGEFTEGDLDFLRWNLIPTSSPSWYDQEISRQKQHWDPTWGPFTHDKWQDMSDILKVHTMREIGPYQRFGTGPSGPVPSATTASPPTSGGGLGSIIKKVTPTATAPTTISMANTLSQNIAANQAQAAANQKILQAARARIKPATGGRVGLAFGTPEEGIKSLEAGAPDITYEGDEGPKAPMKMAGGIEMDANNEIMERIVDDLMEADPNLSIEDAIEQAKKIFNQMSGGPILPEDPTKPINPFTPKPIGPVLPDKMMAAKGGRIGYQGGGNVFELLQKELEGTITPEELKLLEKLIEERGKDSLPFAQGGRIGQLYGTGPQGLPGIPRMAPDGMEFDMRQNGGFQGLGKKEGKDDVPAMLAKNEFVFTADAVRGAGGGDIELGAQRMYDTMKNLEKRVV